MKVENPNFLLQAILYNIEGLFWLEIRWVQGNPCRAHPEVHSIHLFGSLARTDHVGTSDVDVLIVLFEPDDPDPPVLIGKYYPYFDLPISTDLVVIDQPTLEKRLAGNDPWIRKTWGEKIALASNLDPGG